MDTGVPVQQRHDGRKVPYAIEHDGPFVRITEFERGGGAAGDERQPGMSEEVIVTDENTGGRKGVKPERYDLIPVWPLRMVARVYGWGTKKYADRNWELGYKWSNSYSAGQRHLNAFWGGEWLDQESGLPHLAHAAWHCLTLMTYMVRQIGTDDRSEVDKWV